MTASRREIVNIIKYLAVYGFLLVATPTVFAVVLVVNDRLHGGSMNSDTMWESPWLITGMLIGTLLNIAVFMGKRWAVIDLGRIRRADVWTVVVMSLLLFVGWFYPEGVLMDLVDLEDNLTSDEFDNLTAGVAGFVDTGIMAPVAEELLCRGAILGALLRLMPRRPWVAIVAQALIFGLIHMNPVQIVFGGLYGLLLGWLCWRTSSLLPGIVVHVVNNSCALLIPESVGERLFNLSPVMTLTAIAISVGILLCGVLWFQRKYCPRP